MGDVGDVTSSLRRESDGEGLRGVRPGFRFSGAVPCDKGALRGLCGVRPGFRFSGVAPCASIGSWPDRCGSNTLARSIT